jgi:hypothetical protein
MPFHVEISRSFRRARAFNLGEEDLRGTVLEPWAAGRLVLLGDREWNPRECALRVLEGPELSSVDLAQGQGWQRAERAGTDVARALLAGPAVPAVAVHADDPAAREVSAAAVEQLGWAVVPWAAARAGGATLAVYAFAAETDPLAAFTLGAAVGGLAQDRVLALPASSLADEHAVGVLVARLSALTLSG